jgi:hypothetical protein
MVAYGVLELKHKNTNYFLMELPPEQQRQEARDDEERNQLRKLVNDELKRYGLLLSRSAVPHRDKWRTKSNEHILYGQVIPGPFNRRQEIAKGSFRECCVVAAALLDKLEASQVPDTAAGSDQR